MNLIGLFVLAASLIAALWAGQIELVPAAIIFFAAGATSDLLGILSTFTQKWVAAKSAEVMITGMPFLPSVKNKINESLSKPKSSDGDS